MKAPIFPASRGCELIIAILLFLFLQPGSAEIMLTSSSDWPLYGRSFDNQRFSPLSQVHAGNVQKLRLAWRYQTGKFGSFQTSPIIRDGIMYLTTPYNDVIALHAGTGKELWRYRHELPEDGKYCCGPRQPRAGAECGQGVYRHH